MHFWRDVYEPPPPKRGWIIFWAIATLGVFLWAIISTIR